MSRRRPRRFRCDPTPADIARLARTAELLAGVEERCAYIRAQFPHAQTWAHTFGSTWRKPR